MTDLTWDDLDRRAVDTARLLAADAVEKVGNGHPDIYGIRLIL